MAEACDFAHVGDRMRRVDDRDSVPLCRLLRANGFEIENMVELYPAEGATATDFPYATNEWARQWPAEEVWIARKRG